MNTSISKTANKIIAMIENDGPVTLERYMQLCVDAYYGGSEPFGRSGDYITAPEVSQMFGEAIGVWMATAWQMLGSPKKCNLVELGPGRGTLMADILRTVKILPGLTETLQLHLVETSYKLRDMQKQKLEEFGVTVCFHDSFASIPANPSLFVANEFFDALPIRQLIKTGDVWRERMIGFENGELAFAAGDIVEKPEWAGDGNDGDIIEISQARQRAASMIAEHVAANGGAGLIIDYGHEKSVAGDTFQAVSKHKFVDVLQMPGSCDVTAHVDFEQLGKDLVAGGAEIHGPKSQGEFLIAMGLREREAMLKKKAPARVRINLSRQAARLVSDKQMGLLFKVLAVTSHGLGKPHPFGDPNA